MALRSISFSREDVTPTSSMAFFRPRRKIFCRCFQAVLRFVLPVLPYRDPKVLPHVQDIPLCLKEKHIRRVLIVTDGFLRISGMLEPLKKALTDAGIGYTIYGEVTPNPTVLNVELARERYLAENCQELIGFGGGSAIDCAKAAGARIARPKLSIPKMKGILKIWFPIPYLIAVPTTAGTGSETTLTTVITDHTTFPIHDFPLIPRAAALEAAKLIGENLEKAYRDGNPPADIAAAALIAEICRMNKAMNISEKLPGIRKEDISRLAKHAAREANPLYPVPKLMDASQLERFYYDVMEETR